LVLFGTEKQKEQFLPPAASGKGRLAALALTEPGAGSDLQGGVQTRAEHRTSGWVLNGTKAWCTNASLADFILVLARSDPRGGSHSLSLFIVPTHTPGLHIAPAEKKMGLRGSPTHGLILENIQLPDELVLGEVGHGLRQVLSVLDGGRISIGALSVGLAQSAFEAAVMYAKDRQTFGRPIAEYQAIQWMLADAATEIQAARWMVYHAAWLKEQGRSFTRAAAMAKLFASETSERVCRNAIQIHGGYGYSREYPVELAYRDARLMTIGEGTSEMQRLVIARSLLSE